MNDHGESLSIEFIQDTQLIIVLKQTRDVIPFVVIKSDIDTVCVSGTFSLLMFGDNEDRKIFVQTNHVVIYWSIFIAVIMVGLY